MSSLNEQHLSIQVRQKLRMPPSATLDIQPLVSVGLNQLAIEVAGDYKRRHWMLTDPSTVTVALTSGVADLTTLISTNKILIDFIRYGFVYRRAVTNQPAIWINQVGAGRLQGPFDTLFDHIWQQGNFLYLRGPNGTSPTGTLFLGVNYVASLAQLDSSLNDDLVNTIARLIVVPAQNENAA